MHKLNKTLLYTTLSFAGACNVSKNEMNQEPDVVPTSKCSDQQQPTDRLDAVKQAEACYDELNTIFTALKEQQERFDAKLANIAHLEPVEQLNLIPIQYQLDSKIVKARQLTEKLEELLYQSRKKNSKTSVIKTIEGYFNSSKEQFVLQGIKYFKSFVVSLELFFNENHQSWLDYLQRVHQKIAVLMQHSDQDDKQKIKLLESLEDDEPFLAYQRVSHFQITLDRLAEYEADSADLLSIRQQLDYQVEIIKNKVTLRKQKLSELKEKLNQATANS